MAQQIKKKFIGDDQVDGDKLLLEQGQAVRAKDSVGVEQDLIKLGASDEVLVKGEEVALKSDITSLDGRLDIIEGADTVEGSVAKAEKDAKDYADLTFIPLAQKAQPNGVATLGVDGKIPSTQIPSIAITTVSVVADIAARDALTPDEGDVAKVIDAGAGLSKTYIYGGVSWIELTANSDVDSVNGQTGTVVLDASDISVVPNINGLASVDVQAALIELQDEINSVSGGSGTAISDLQQAVGVLAGETNLGTFSGSTIADNSSVKSALQSLETAVETASGSISDHISDTLEAHQASAIFFDPTYLDSTLELGSEDVQLAIQDLDSKKVAKSGDTMSGSLVVDQPLAGYSTLGWSGLQTNNLDFSESGSYDYTGTTIDHTIPGVSQNQVSINPNVISIADTDSVAGTTKLAEIQSGQMSLTFNDGIAAIPMVPVLPEHVTTKKYVDDADTAISDAKVDRAGDTMTGDLIVDGAIIQVTSNDPLGSYTQQTIAYPTSFYAEYVDANVEKTADYNSTTIQMYRSDLSASTTNTELEISVEDGQPLITSSVFANDGSYQQGLIITQSSVAVTNTDNITNIVRSSNYEAGNAVLTVHDALTGNFDQVILNEFGVDVFHFNGVSNSPILPTLDTQLTPKKYVDDADEVLDGAKVNRIGDTLTGFLTLHADPTADYHAVTKKYVDAVAEGLHVHAPVRVLSNVDLGGTYVDVDASVNGQGDKITFSSPVPAIDSIVAFEIGDRVILDAQASGSHNGIYAVSAREAITNKITELTRASDFDTIVEAAGGDFVFVSEGTQFNNSGWVMATKAITIGDTGTALDFIQFSGAGQLIEGDAIDLIGNEINVLFDNSTIVLDSFNKLKVANAGITSLQIATGAVNTDELAADSVTAEKLGSDVFADGIQQELSGALGVKLDGTSLAVSSSGLKVNLAFNKQKFVYPADFTIGASITVTLAHSPELQAVSAYVDRLAIHEGAAEDYQVSGSTITFLNDLVSPGTQALSAGDTVFVKYYYKV